MSAYDVERFRDRVLALLAGELDASSREEVLESARACPEFQAEFAALQMLWTDLEELGEEARHGTPRIDVVEAVLAEVHDARTQAGCEMPADQPSAEQLSNEAAYLFVEPCGDDAAEELQAFSSLSSAHQREVAAFGNLLSDLRALGESETAKATDVDMAGQVMRIVSGKDCPGSLGANRTKRLHLRRDDSGTRIPQVWAWVAMAATILIAFALGSHFFGERSQNGQPVVSQASAPESEQQGPPANPVPHVGDSPAERGGQISLAEALSKLAGQIKQETPPKPEPDSVTEPESRAMTLAQIWETRQAALHNPEAIQKLLAMATIDQKTAESIVEQPESSPPAIVGAAVHLPPEQADDRLRTARGQFPESPYVPFAQAQAISKRQTAHSGTAQGIDWQQLQAVIRDLRALDPDNAITYYWEALALLQQGDIQAALSVLEGASELERANAYSIESAQFREAALEAANLGDNTASALAAFTGGLREYQFLYDMGMDLLSQAEVYLDAGNPDAAQELMQAALRYGDQVETGAGFSWEQLAGLDVQRQAIEALQGVYTGTESASGLSSLHQEAMNLLTGMENMVRLFDELDQLFSSEADPEALNQLSELILEVGDINLFDYLEN